MMNSLSKTTPPQGREEEFLNIPASSNCKNTGKSMGPLKIETVESSKRSSTPRTESESSLGASSPTIPPWTGTNHSSEEIDSPHSPLESHDSFASADPLLRSLMTNAKVTKGDLEKDTYYIRYDTRQGLFLDHSPDTQTNYFSKRNETKAVAQKLVESYRNQYGDTFGDILEQKLKEKFGLRYSMITFHDLAPVTETAQFYQEALQVPPSLNNPSHPNVTVSSENISLKEHHVVLFKQEGMDGAPQQNIVMLPRHYIYSATTEELEAIKMQKTGFVDLQEKQLQKISASSEEAALETLLHGKEWPRVQIRINDRLLPYDNDGAIDLATFKKEVHTLLNKEPSNYELIQILTMLNKEGRVAGLSKGGQTGKVLLTETYTPPSENKTQNETVTLSYEDGKVAFNYHSQVSKLGSLNVTTPSGNVGYSLRTVDNMHRPADLYKMQRLYKATLQLAEHRPDNADEADNAKDIAQRLHVEKSGQLFFA